MSKYIDAEKLKTELESIYDNMLRRIKIDTDYWEGKADAYRNVIDAITSLQQEQPDNEDIDKVAQELYEHLYELKRRNNVPTNLYDKKEIIEIS